MKKKKKKKEQMYIILNFIRKVITKTQSIIFMRTPSKINFPTRTYSPLATLYLSVCGF